jgi:hypothetical protein
VAARYAVPFAALISGVGREMLTARHFLLKRKKMNELQASGMAHPDGIALCVFVE